jgi:hypothetical protein
LAEQAEAQEKLMRELIVAVREGATNEGIKLGVGEAIGKAVG